MGKVRRNSRRVRANLEEHRSIALTAGRLGRSLPACSCYLREFASIRSAPSYALDADMSTPGKGTMSNRRRSAAGSQTGSSPVTCRCPLSFSRRFIDLVITSPPYWTAVVSSVDACVVRL